uniref:Uncharacterized protein n=1 Tax=Oryza sativa subsp. japonica TaxID=39947 RepID=Q69ML3_ORYSJ|nr:hypothetical protein [Oryza sativa Japonica Group]
MMDSQLAHHRRRFLVVRLARLTLERTCRRMELGDKSSASSTKAFIAEAEIGFSGKDISYERRRILALRRLV